MVLPYELDPSGLQSVEPRPVLIQIENDPAERLRISRDDWGIQITDEAHIGDSDHP